MPEPTASVVDGSMSGGGDVLSHGESDFTRDCRGFLS